MLLDQFRLMVHGEHFDVDTFLKDSGLSCNKIWQRGDKWHSDVMHKTSGFTVLLGDGTCLTLAEQTTLAIDYLEKNQSELKRVSKFKGASIRNLMIHYFLPNTPGLCGVPLNMNNHLAHYSLVTGISVTYLIDLEHHCP